MKRKLYEACFHAAITGYLFLSFTDNMIVMRYFMHAVLGSGRNIHGVGKVDVENILQCANAVRNDILSGPPGLQRILRIPLIRHV